MGKFSDTSSRTIRVNDVNNVIVLNANNISRDILGYQRCGHHSSDDESQYKYIKIELERVNIIEVDYLQNAQAFENLLRGLKLIKQIILVVPIPYENDELYLKYYSYLKYFEELRHIITLYIAGNTYTPFSDDKYSIEYYDELQSNKSGSGILNIIKYDDLPENVTNIIEYNNATIIEELQEFIRKHKLFSKSYLNKNKPFIDCELLFLLSIPWAIGVGMLLWYHGVDVFSYVFSVLLYSIVLMAYFVLKNTKSCSTDEKYKKIVTFKYSKYDELHSIRLVLYTFENDIIHDTINSVIYYESGELFYFGSMYGNIFGSGTFFNEKNMSILYKKLV